MTESTEIAWRCAQPGLWVAKDAQGRPVGIVSERWHDGFVATAVNGRALGRFDRLDAAKAALETSAAAALSQ
ncbi:hypothetical protein [Herbiconiux sp.]|jgi:hypothetical protein|uniref:hypothetical protein n=1 Tax=Herbiconiux sp. TaxID=1871186 RepID=UPI0025C5A434|nr:hypothetical protein [Herbiconiux sp.]